ncbi:MAG: SgcJ/EcaC family oxidoreductase [Acidobacteriaceae bacterium]|nr:SgcJ/EcaC family oxidoreductase [Acidobacteriaceae bacterium]
MIANERITALLADYNDALNASSTEAVMKLYADDGVFMPPYSESAVGATAVRQAYDAVFNKIRLNVKFTIVEIVQLSPGWAFARTNSAGTTTEHSTGAVSHEGNQELFIFKQDDTGSWKIARYSFSPTSPPKQR